MTDPAPRRLRRAEAVLARRTDRVLLVLERLTDPHNVEAILRTAEALGLVDAWLVDQDDETGRRVSASVSRGARRWLEVRRFARLDDCLAALRDDRRTLWVSDLHPGADEVTDADALRPVPERLAIAVGRESDGVSAELRAAASRRLFLPMHGFTESLNVSVATGMLLQRLFDACPEARGALPAERRDALRRRWVRMLLRGAGAEERARWITDPPPPLDDVRPPEELRRPRMPKKLAKRLGIRLRDDDGGGEAP